ncbi:MAG: NAD(P)H-dependent oxidoreductase [Lactimicrobium massiliense]|nr:NAD(P)H-dependent oxidoreductase [Lactimicrobium massiliense]MDD6559795.1 NAD(P)H-dependent oxidoreductase [Lactimicrobium massiliense]
MKTIVLNASPRKTWNTAKLLKSAAKGAEDAGAQVTYIDLYDLNFTGCRSCMLCK